MGDRDRNVGRLDRIVRVPVGGIAVLGIIWVYRTYPLHLGVVASLLLLGVVASIMLISATTGTCGIYGAVGIDTCQDCIDESPDEAWGAG
jgi:hypothetical protein